MASFTLRRYTIAFVAVAIAFGLKQLAGPALQGDSPFRLYVAAIVVSAWFGGIGPSLFATLLSTLLGSYFFLEPTGVIVKPDAAQNLRLLTFAMEGTFLSMLAGMLHSARRRAEQSAREMKMQADRLHDSEEHLRLLVQGVEEYAIFMVGPNGYIASWNNGAKRIFGYDPEEIIGQHAIRLFPPEAVAANGIDHFLVAAGAGKTEHEGWRVRKDGSRFWTSTVLTPVTDREGQMRGFSVVTRDVTRQRQMDETLRQAKEDLEHRVAERTEALEEELHERRKAEAALQVANEQLAASNNKLVQRTEEMTLLNKMSDLLQACNTSTEAYRVILQYARQLFPVEHGSLYIRKASKNLLESVADWGPECLASKVFAPDDCWALRRGRVYLVDAGQPGLTCPHICDAPVHQLCIPLTAHGETVGVLTLCARPSSIETRQPTFGEGKQKLALTVTDHIALAIANLDLRESLRNQAIRDPLTGLFNRRYMEESFEIELQRAARTGDRVGLIVFDIDHFKRFNDTYGHQGGDDLLRALGEHLRATIRGGDIACRYGGEEFVLILPAAITDSVAQRAEQLRQELKQLHVSSNGQSLGVITISLGVAGYPQHGETVPELIRAADAALYQAKREGRDRVIVARSSDS